MFTDRILADWPIAEGASQEEKSQASERLCALLYRFGGEDPTCSLTPDGRHVRTMFTFSAPSESEAQAVASAIVARTTEALQHDAYDHVDEYPWPRGEDQGDLPKISAEVDRLLQERRLRFSLYPMPSEAGGIVVEINDVGGATPREATRKGRSIIQEVYADAYLKVTGKLHVARPKSIGGIGGTD